MTTSNGYHGDVFTRWIVGIAGTVVVSVGLLLVNTIARLNEDVAVISSKLVRIEAQSAQVQDHELQIQLLKNKPCLCDDDKQRNKPTQFWSPNKNE